MKTHLPKKWALFCAMFVLPLFLINAQVGIGTTTPHDSSILDIRDPSGSKGLLIPQVALTSTNVSTPVTPSPATSLLVYNTATAGSGATAVKPGYYYWNGIRWYAMDGTNGKDWSVDGNYGTNADNNFLGTLDANDLVFRTSDTERMRFAATGNAGINHMPYGNAKLNIESNDLDYGLFVNSNSSANGIAIVGLQSGDGDGVSGQNSGGGIGVFGYAANAYGVLGQTPYTGGSYLTAGTVGIGTGENNANGMLAATVNPASSMMSAAFRAISGGSTSFSNSAYLNVGVNTNSKQLGLYSLTEGPIFTGGSNYRVYESAMFHTNYAGEVIDSDGRDPMAKLAGYAGNITISTIDDGNVSGRTFYGGYFYSGGVATNASYAYAGSRVGNTNYKIIGNGTVSTIVEGAAESDSKKIMFAPEAPEVLFQDYGIGQLVNGTTTIIIDPIFSRNIDVNNSRPLKVFIQLEGDCNGVYVTNKSANGFTVNELQNGRANVPFSWQIVANRKDEAGRNGSEGSTYASLRFPDAPGPMEIKTGIAQEIIMKNEITPKLTSADSKRN